MKDKKYTIGLDVSTSYVGICIFKNGDFCSLHYVELVKEKDFFKKCKIFRQQITELLDKEEIVNPDIFVEDILQGFSRGLSSAKTITQLARFNGIVSNIMYELTESTPVYLNVNSARKILGIKIDKNSNTDKKEQILNWVTSDIGFEYNWPKRMVTRGKYKNIVKLEKYCYDMADAYVICKAGTINNVISNNKTL